MRRAGPLSKRGPRTAVSDAEYQPREFYYTDAIADHAVKFIREHARDQKERPFFIYTAFTAAHWPLHAKESDVAKYKGRYDGGYEPVRAGRLARLKELGILDRQWVPAPPAESWDAVQEAGWPGERIMPTAGAHRVRVAVSTLRKLGLRDALRTVPEGYLLDPSLRVVRTDRSERSAPD